MKTIIFKVIIAGAIFFSSSLMAQSTIDKLYEKYAGKDGFTSINISPEMFSMLGSFDTEDSSQKAQNDQNVMKQLTGLKMLVYEPDEEGNIDFIKEVKSFIPSNQFSELMSVDSEDEIVKFLVKKDANNRISEMLMIAQDGQEVVIMSLTGDLDMNTISSISRSLDIDGMEKLEKIEE